MDLSKIAPIIVDNFKEALEEKKYKFGNPPNKVRLGNKIASKTLYNSIEATPSKDAITIKMEDYGIYVQGGRRRGDKGVPISALLEWMKQRGIRSNDLTDRQLAFAIQSNIKKFGIRPSNWFDVAIDNMFEDARFSDIFETEVAQDIEDRIVEIIDKLEGI
jgi:hypothetical protein